MARFNVNDIQINVEQWNEGAIRKLVLLHGFTGSTKTWHKVIQYLPQDVHIIALDCIGHGQSDAPQEVNAYSMEAQVHYVYEVLQQLKIEHFILLGYSMGGRVALSYAAAYPQQIEQLILESASPGLIFKEERKARKEADDALAQKILENGIVSFVNKWENIPLFASQKTLPSEIQQAIREERLSQRVNGLANSLRGMGTGVMPALWDALPMLPMPVKLITGELDKKFIGLNERMQNSLQNAVHLTIPAVGHAIHVENPQKFATIVKEMISTL